MTNDNGKWPLPEGWVWTTLGEVSAINRRDPRLREQQDDLEVTFLPMAAVDEIQGQIADPQIRKLSDVKKGFTPFSEGDVLFAKITPSMENGKAAIARGLKNGIGFGSTEFHVFSPENGVLSEWVFYYVRQVAFREDAKANFSGTAGQLRVRKDFLEPYPIPLPPLPTQHRIVAEIEKQFTRLDAAVAALRRAKANLARYKAAVLKAAVEGRLVAQDAAGEPASALLARILAERRACWEAAHPGKKYVEPKRPDVDDLPELPEGWVWANLSQMSTKITDGTHSTPKYVQHGIPFISVNNLDNDGQINFGKTKYITMEEHRELFKRCNPERGDVLLSKVGTVGLTAVVNTDREFSLFVNTALIKPVSHMISKYLSHALRYGFQTSLYDSMISGSTQKFIGTAKIGMLVIALPPLSEQMHIVAELDRRLSIIQSTEQTLDANLARAERLRQGVLGKAFRGDL